MKCWPLSSNWTGRNAVYSRRNWHDVEKLFRGSRFSAPVNRRPGSVNSPSINTDRGAGVIKERMNLYSLFNETVRPFGSREWAVCSIQSTSCEWDGSDTNDRKRWRVIAFVLSWDDVAFCRSKSLHLKRVIFFLFYTNESPRGSSSLPLSLYSHLLFSSTPTLPPHSILCPPTIHQVNKIRAWNCYIRA